MLTHRRNRFLVLLTGLRNHSVEQLLQILREQRYPPLLRLAALRWLIHWAPLEVIVGSPYSARRRCVRQHYRV